MRYRVATVVVSMQIAAFLAFHWWIRSQVAFSLRQTREQAGLPPNTPTGDFGVALPGYLITCITVDDLVLKFWFVVLPMIVLICFGIAATLPRKRAEPAPKPTPSATLEPGPNPPA